jgi:hypothetical protein
VAVLCCAMIHATAVAQAPGTATVTRTAPGAILYVGGVTPSPLRKDATLQPRDVIDTEVSGSVVIALGDGSQVVISPRSRVELMDFQAGVPWRDLLKVTVGRVRATISHQLKRPNPYRVFSPIASIAVRGTDFLVIVEPSGETRVLVYEGLVEVGSLVSPQKTVLVQPGRNIIVRPDGDISTVTAMPRIELNEIRSLQMGGDQETKLRSAYNSHGSAYTGLRSSRFTAFSDSRLDSLQNPAYATEFRQPSGRFYLTPSFGPRYGDVPGSYILSSEASYFTPLGSRIVVGAGAAVTRTDIGATEANNYFNPVNQTATYSDFEGNVKFTTTNLSLIAARRFGQAGRTSLGLKFDYLVDRSVYSFNRDTNEPGNRQPVFEEGKTSAHRAGLSLGLTQDIGDDKKLGIYYRYSMGSVENRYKQSGALGYINADPQYISGSADFQTRPGHSSEAGALFRGSVTRQLFYGVESSILFGQDQVESLDSFPNTFYNVIYNNNGAYITTQTYPNKPRVKQGRIGFGIGYALRSRIFLSLDVSAGRARVDYPDQAYYASLPSDIRASFFDNRTYEQTSFKAAHIGGQMDVWRNLFAGGAFFNIWEWKRAGGNVYFSEQLRMPQPQPAHSYEDLLSRERRKLFSFSGGWRLTPRWIAQYVYYSSHSYSYGGSPPIHTLMFRYEFGRREEKLKHNSEQEGLER